MSSTPRQFGPRCLDSERWADQVEAGNLAAWTPDPGQEPKSFGAESAVRLRSLVSFGVLRVTVVAFIGDLGLRWAQKEMQNINS